MHSLFIYNYLQICKTQTVPFLVVLPIIPPQDSLTQQGLRWRLRLVDSRQLLHNLNDLIHCGFTLHAAPIIDLKSNDTTL